MTALKKVITVIIICILSILSVIGCNNEEIDKDTIAKETTDINYKVWVDQLEEIGRAHV